MDVTVYLDAWAKPGETIAARDGKIALGGKGANQAIASARLGADVTMIGAVGADGFGAQAIESLVGDDVKLEMLRSERLSTGVALIDVNADGANMIRLFAGANSALNQVSIKARKSIFEGAGVVLLQNEIPFEASVEAAVQARAHGAIVVMDPAPAPLTPWSQADVLAFDILTPNSHEAEIILGRKIPDQAAGTTAAKELRELGLKGAIVTMGAMGAAWAFGDSQGFVSPHPVNSVDTVAAGDCFNAGFAFALTRNMEFEHAVGFACDVASLATSRHGASASAPTYREVVSFRLSNPKRGLSTIMS
jgi:ribokinase